VLNSAILKIGLMTIPIRSKNLDFRITNYMIIARRI